MKYIGSIPKNIILTSAAAVGLYPKSLHQAGLKAFKEFHGKRHLKKIPTEDLMKKAEFVLDSNGFEFNRKHVNRNQVQL